MQMMSSRLSSLLRLPALFLLLSLLLPIAATAGYHYDRPTAQPTPVFGGHKFGVLPTIHPLPPVPALPALPTPRSMPRTRIQPQLQRPTAPAASIISHYLPPKKPTAETIVSHYLPPIASPITKISYHGVQPGHSVYGPPQHLQAAPIVVPSAPAATPGPIVVQPEHSVYGPPQHLQAAPIVVPSAPAATPGSIVVRAGPAAEAQPLRIPFGKQALISPGESYIANGRQLKQYAVIEIIDNDIDQSAEPFLKSAFFDQYRAHIGASGTGALPPSASGSGIQIESRANALLLEQQALGAQTRTQQGDAIALGSGGLGYIRLPNGNVYLGSGSLGYISGQQRVASVLAARTRADSTPDALHFGHGPLGGADNFLRFK